MFWRFLIGVAGFVLLLIGCATPQEVLKEPPLLPEVLIVTDSGEWFVSIGSKKVYHLGESENPLLVSVNGVSVEQYQEHKLPGPIEFDKGTVIGRLQDKGIFIFKEGKPLKQYEPIAK